MTYTLSHSFATIWRVPARISHSLATLIPWTGFLYYQLPCLPACSEVSSSTSSLCNSSYVYLHVLRPDTCPLAELKYNFHAFYTRNRLTLV